MPSQEEAETRSEEQVVPAVVVGVDALRVGVVAQLDAESGPVGEVVPLADSDVVALEAGVALLLHDRLAAAATGSGRRDLELGVRHAEAGREEQVVGDDLPLEVRDLSVERGPVEAGAPHEA